MLTPLCVAQAKHRRIRRWDILWKVYDLAVQWRALARRQEARQAAYAEAMDRPEATDDDRQAMDGLLEKLKDADSPEVSSFWGQCDLFLRRPPVTINSVLCHRSFMRYRSCSVHGYQMLISARAGSPQSGRKRASDNERMCTRNLLLCVEIRHA